MTRIALICFVTFCMTPTASAEFASGWWPQASLTSPQARDGVKRGNLSLSQIYAKLRRQYGGTALDARLVDGNIYLILWETSDGRVMNLRVDAKTGRIL